VPTARRIIEEIRAAGAEAIPLKADVTSEEEVQSMFRTFRDAFGRIDILVANSGIQMDAAASEMPLEQWRRVIDVYLTGQFLCAREAIHCFSEQGASLYSKAAGKIVCMSSVQQIIPWKGHVNYAASKGGVMLMMKSLAEGGCRDARPRQCHRSGRDQDADQSCRLGHPRGGKQASASYSVWARWRAGGCG
jgi:glucose 1-dehydrogenase